MRDIRMVIAALLVPGSVLLVAAVALVVVLWP